jgi:hypothetical protein
LALLCISRLITGLPAQMHEQSAMSWTSKGSMEDLLKSFGQFPEWIKETFKAAPELGLWQLRDLVRQVQTSNT